MKKTLIFFFLFLNSISYGQTISGVVLDSIWQEPIPFAKISLVNSKKTVLSNVQGQFSIPLTQLTDSLKITSIGYENYIILIDGAPTAPLIIKLKSNTTLKEVEVMSTNFKAY